MFFKEVIGQEAAKQRLRQEVQEGRIPHAQLFCGPSGVGKLPLAMAYARYICCPNRTDTDACGTCPSCIKWNKLVHPDVHFVFPIVKKGKKEVCDDYITDWRHLVLNSPYFSLNHWLNEMDAENGQAIIYAKESDEIVRKLSLKSSEGGNGDFIKALDTIHLNEENELFFELFVSLMRLSYQRKIREMKQWSEQLAGMGRERQKNFLTYAQRMIRENFIYNLHCKEMSYMTLPEQNFATRFAPFINERNVMGMMDELSEAQIHIEQNVNARMVFFDFSLKMIVLLKQ